MPRILGVFEPILMQIYAKKRALSEIRFYYGAL